jgi:hypothetical protein
MRTNIQNKNPTFFQLATKIHGSISVLSFKKVASFLCVGKISVFIGFSGSAYLFDGNSSSPIFYSNNLDEVLKEAERLMYKRI